jgi:type IV pilus assembly protein PilY1
MKKMNTTIRCTGLIIVCCLLLLSLPALSQGAMNDYCITPPFVVGGITPNLLLMIDNSASMFDLNYIDNGTATRDDSYCYDRTYSSSKTYVGYFEVLDDADPPNPIFYNYNIANEYFDKIPALPIGCDYFVADTLCINVNIAVSPHAVTTFAASGNYLNWLTASKFDVQKAILTGGKYDTVNQNLLNETRGCVGRKFIKEAMDADFQEYNDPLDPVTNPDPNASLGITFGVRGPLHPINEALPSIGGETWVDIFEGAYNETFCQDAVDAFEAGNDPASIKKAVDDCLSALEVPSTCALDPGGFLVPSCSKDSDCLVDDNGVCSRVEQAFKTCQPPTGDPAKHGLACIKPQDCDWDVGPCQKPAQTVETKQKVVFNQAIQACWAYLDVPSTPIGIDDANTVMNQCDDIYDENWTCIGGALDGNVCDPAVPATCPAPGVCDVGPQVIRPGNASLLCGNAYAGQCYDPATGLWDQCTLLGNCGIACIIETHENFCNDTAVPPVTDPTDVSDETDKFFNLPAIIGDIGIEAQLGEPIAHVRVRVHEINEPKGLIQEFKDLIRFGAMSFNSLGSATECVLPGPGPTPCTYVCSGTGTVCGWDGDCLPGETCIAAVDKDGGRVIHHIENVCNITMAQSCNIDTDCPAGEECILYVGDHSTGLVNAIDGIKAHTWTPFAEGFYNAIGYFANDGNICINTPGACLDFDVAKDPVQYKCQKNNLLLISDGMSTGDRNLLVEVVAKTDYTGGGQPSGDGDPETEEFVPKYGGSTYIDDLAWIAKHRNIKDFNIEPGYDFSLAKPSESFRNSQTITTHVVFNGAESQVAGPDESVPQELMRRAATNGGGTFQRAENPVGLYLALERAFLQIAGRAASGTAASVLASGEGTGANLVQAIFYPERSFGGDEILWTGTLKNLWYHIDPLLGNSTIREDSVYPGVSKDDILNLEQDWIIHFFFNEDLNLTQADLFEDSDADGAADNPTTPDETVFFENVDSLWEAGTVLWQTLPANRTILTTTDGSTLIPFNTPVAAAPDLITFLQVDNASVAEKIIDYIRGEDYKACSVTTAQPCMTDLDCPAGETCEQAKFCSLSVGLICDVDGDCPVGETCISTRNRTITNDIGFGDETHVWKLGDIINSTPRIISWVPLNAYEQTYNDFTYEDFTELATYTDRGLVLSGANDGMLHAFELGVLELFEERLIKAKINGATGLEKWAYIPSGALPYLKYIADPDYCHVYSIDLTPYIFDASIGNGGANYWDDAKDKTTWRTIVIGGMRIGGAAKDACTNDINDDAIVDSDDCVITPAAGYGYSTYFALDITDVNNPQLLWEFSNEDIPVAELADGGLGYTTSSPAVVRISASADKTKNGRWFVVFGSGPTGPIDTNSHQFRGYSDQPLKVFILDLATGQLLRTINSGIPYAFAGSMVDASIDYDQNDPSSESNYQDDALYFGFVRAENDPPVAATRWNVGGVMRLTTKNDLDPSNWVLSRFINTGPVTAQVAKLQDFKNDKAFLFWGTGRYFYKITNVIDDATNQRAVYGVNEPCFGIGGFDDTCTDTVNFADLGDATATASADADGWYILLDQCTDENGIQYANCADPAVEFMTERVVTDPLATPIGAVFFTTTKPASDACEFGGTSHLWAVDWDTGGAVSSSVLRGKAVMQVSTASIEEIDLKTAFTEKVDADSGQGRRTVAFQGVPPAGSPPGILVPPDPVNKFIHIFEK